MFNANKEAAAIILAGIIVVKSVFHILLPEFEVKKYVEAFFDRQTDILAVMGGNISENGIQAAVSAAFSLHDENA